MQCPFGILIWPKDCDLLEKLQWRSARFVKGDYRTTSSVSQMLHDLHWSDLKDRRRDLRLALLYKIVTVHVAINPDQIGLVAAECGQQDQSKLQIQIQGNRGIFDWAALLICCQNSQWLEPAPCCCCWAGESSCLQSSIGQVCACRMP